MKRITKCESKHRKRGFLLSLNLELAEKERNLMNNIILPKSLILSLVGLLLITFSAAAGTSVEGVVKDRTGRPIQAADVRIEAKNFSKVVRTDTSGHYICDGLGVGTYKVTLVVNGQVKASILDAETQAGKATQLNFTLTGKMVSTKKNTHMVYVRPSVDTSIGGRWVELDENGNVVGTTGLGASSVETIRGAAVPDWILRNARIQSANTQ
jgi:hypothetical protein